MKNNLRRCSIVGITLVCAVLVSCKTVKRKPVTLVPALPNRSNTIRASLVPQPPPPKPAVVQPGFRITNITVQAGTVTVQWQDAPGPVMVQQSPVMGGMTWTNIGPANAAYAKTFANTWRGFVRLQSWPTLHLQTNQPRLVWEPIDVMPDYISKWRIERGQGSSEPVWNPGTGDPGSGDTVAVVTQILTLAVPKTIPAPGSDQTFTVNEAIDWVNLSGNGDYFNLEGKGQFRAVGKDNGTKTLTLRYIPLADAPNNTHENETAGANLKLSLASYRDTTAPDPKVWYQNQGFKASDVAMADPIKQNVVSLSSLIPGAVAWAYQWPLGNSAEYAYGVAVDSHNDAIVVGSSATIQVTGFINKISSSGALIWSRGLALDRVRQSVITCVTTVGTDIYISGYFTGLNNDLGNGITISALGGNDIFVAKLDGAGVTQWARVFGSAELPAVQMYKCGRAIAVSPSGKVIVGGAFYGTVSNPCNFGPSTQNGNPINKVSHLNADAFVVQLSADGTTTDWVKGFGGSENATAGVTANQAGDVFAVGGFSNNNVDPSDGNGGQLISATKGIDAFLVKYSSTGEMQWVKSFGSTDFNAIGYSNGNDSFNAVAVGPDGNVVVNGVYTGPQSFGGPSVVANHYLDIVIAKYNGITGDWIWDVTTGSSGDDGFMQILSAYGKGLAIDPAGNIYAVGGFTGPIDFGGKNTFNRRGDFDIWVVKLQPDKTHVWSRGLGTNKTSIGGGVGIATDGIVVAGNFWSTITFDRPGDPFPSIVFNSVSTTDPASDRDMFTVKLNP